ncbi:MAG TPA: hypothetical protein VNB91_09820, partial [Jatrophihabitantaceae bacterium]|nr:hypothetical protein [Jatrophihabitantaceae bacterium]
MWSEPAERVLGGWQVAGGLVRDTDAAQRRGRPATATDTLRDRHGVRSGVFGLRGPPECGERLAVLPQDHRLAFRVAEGPRQIQSRLGVCQTLPGPAGDDEHVHESIGVTTRNRL